MQFVLPSHFFSSMCGLLRTIACIAAGEAHWMVPTPRIDDVWRPAREDSAGRALGDIGGTITHGRCPASSGNYAVRIGHIGVTHVMTNPSANACESPRKV